MKYVSHNAQETGAIARDIATDTMAKMPFAKTAMVLALIGDLGAGKTTFAKSFASALGIIENVTSPTFTLLHRFSVPASDLTFWHMDGYRLEGRDDLVNLDLPSVFADPRNIVLVEWPEKAKDIFPKEHVVIHFTHQGSDKRGITVKWPPSLR
jgi:tRNA threonylcarbamoyladenosine biosynthesis protein TsaE